MDEDASTSKWGHYLLKVENLVNLGLILFLSLGSIVVALWAMFGASQQTGFAELGELIFPWITMLALMIIAREQWVSNIREADRNKDVEHPAY